MSLNHVADCPTGGRPPAPYAHFDAHGWYISPVRDLGWIALYRCRCRREFWQRPELMADNRFHDCVACRRRKDPAAL